ncbi:MAG TPA: hypothetical protein VFK05_33555 [Polyangiaceae bacterium]|nr:hypothetical protein [Polyangiaceae bacterium]
MVAHRESKSSRRLHPRKTYKWAGVLVPLGLLYSFGCSTADTQSSKGDSVARQGQALGTTGLNAIYPKQDPNAPKSASAPSTAHLNYYTGRVVSNIQVVEVVYGAGGAGAYLPEIVNNTPPNVPSYYQGVLNSAHVDWLSEYNTTAPVPTPRTDQVIGRGSFLTRVVITPSAANNGTVIDDSNIQAELSAQIAAGNLPAPTHDAAGNNNTYYSIFFPHGKTITLQGFSSCVQFCAYHGTIANAGGLGEVYYGVQPDFQPGSGCELGCGSAATAFGNVTVVASHELVETMTDPEVGLASVVGPPLAWYDTSFGEIGDICVGQMGSVIGSDGVTYDVQKEFSNTAKDCIVTRDGGGGTGGAGGTGGTGGAGAGGAGAGGAGAGGSGGTSSGGGPCAGLCSNPKNITWSGSYQGGNIGTGAVCLQTTQVVHGGNCGNFVSPRSLQVNGQSRPCNNLNWPTIPPARNGGYCVQATAGNQPWAFITLW